MDHKFLTSRQKKLRVKNYFRVVSSFEHASGVGTCVYYVKARAKQIMFERKILVEVYLNFLHGCGYFLHKENFKYFKNL